MRYSIRDYQKFKQSILFLVIIVLLMAGAFGLGTIVSADVPGGPVPGSADDPLVSESYVQMKAAELEARINELEAQITELENRLAGYNPSSSDQGSREGNTPNTSEPGDNPFAMKKVYIKNVDTYANIRKSPSLQAEVVKKVLPDASLEWVETSGDWYCVRFNDESTGWIHNSIAELR